MTSHVINNSYVTTRWKQEKHTLIVWFLHIKMLYHPGNLLYICMADLFPCLVSEQFLFFIHEYVLIDFRSIYFEFAN